MRVLAFAATNSSGSINRQLIDHAADLLEQGLVDDVKVETIDLNDYEMPIYSVDREAEGGIPQPAADFFAAIGRADALLISFAEHNGGYTAAYKNLFDWTSRIDQQVFQDTPSVLLSTSPGPSGGANVLRTAATSAPFFGTEVLAQLSIPAFHENFDQDGGTVRQAEIAAELRAALATLGTITDQTTSAETTSEETVR